MFILRRITLELMQINTYLGLEYVVILKDLSKLDFERTTEQWTSEDKKNLYGVITFDAGESIMPLYEDSTYYIMIEDGKTFSNVSKK